MPLLTIQRHFFAEIRGLAEHASWERLPAPCGRILAHSSDHSFRAASMIFSRTSHFFFIKRVNTFEFSRNTRIQISEKRRTLGGLQNSLVLSKVKTGRTRDREKV